MWIRVVAAVAMGCALVACNGGRDSAGSFRASAGDAGGSSEVKIIRTEHSIPNIVAANPKGLGYGVGFAQAEDNFCILAAMWANYAGEGAKYEGRYLGRGRIDLNLFNAYINKTANLEEILNAPPPHGPTQEVLDLLDGYIEGYNTYLAHHGVDNLPDPECRGADHVRPIDRMDVARRLYELIGKGGRDLVWRGMIQATPPSLTTAPRLPTEVPLFGRVPVYSDVADQVNALLDEIDGGAGAVQPEHILALGQAFAERIENGGSNAVGLGSEATDNGSGLLLANPHWTWDGFDRFWQMHVQIPDELHTSGMGFIGQPLIMIGHNENVAWSHTVSAARRLALAQLTLVPGSPTQYIVDGQVMDMEATEVSIEVLEEDGSIGTRSHTFYSSIYGPVTTSILGIDLLPWTQATAFAMIDMNTGSARIANQFWESNQAQTVDEHYAAHAKWVGNPWATTTVADSNGDTLFTDVGTVPNISNEHAALCNTAVGQVLWNTFAVAVLNGALSACDVPTAPDSVAPKTMPASLQPVIKRKDYVSNSNESHWLTNARAPLTGYSRVFGPENSQRATRTRIGHRMILDRLDGLDGAGKTTFNRQDLQDLLFSNRNMFGELWVDDLVSYCRAVGGQMPATHDGSGAPELVDVGEACDVLESWGRTNSLDDPGAVLFYRFSSLALADLDFTLSYAGVSVAPFWLQPFDPSDPVNTPSGLNPAYLPAYTALADTVKEFATAGIPLDASLRDYQLSEYGVTRAPLHGGAGTLGLFNAMNVRWRGDHIGAGGGGPSFVQTTQFFADGRCPDDRTLLLGSQRSQHAWLRADEQQIKYSQGIWVDPPFCDEELAAAPVESVTILRDGVVERR
nr:penicillin acylase family protein [Oceanococcus sp. HetDA_MAG_MS8]